MNYTNVSNPVWANAEHTAINCLVTFSELGEVPFTATLNDSYSHTTAIFNELLAGNYGSIEEYTIPETPNPPPVTVVTMRQARLALLSRGLLDDITTAINSLPSPQKEAATIEWEYSAEVHRNKALVQMLAPVLGLTETDLDDLFEEASLL